ncbi:MAG: hypothetical protein FD123_3217 [Bacteroidetes bacterium]|nr:MAG: hypothetical protein FD123_3217 [Bacteroidota bacterium]
MGKSEETWEIIAASFTKKKDVLLTKMMGHPSLKTNGKLCCCFFDGDMVFKLSGEEHARALALKGSKLFDPGSMGRPMKEWVQVKPAHEKLWPQFTEAALDYVKSSPAKTKPAAAKAKKKK